MSGKNSPQNATVDELLAKPRRKLEFPIVLDDGDGGTLTRTITFQALSGPEYDKLIEMHPPTPKQREEQAVTNIETFAPALIAAVSLSPELTYEQAERIYNDPSWSGGEVGSLYFNAQRVCNAGLDIPFNARG